MYSSFQFLYFSSLIGSCLHFLCLCGSILWVTLFYSQVCWASLWPFFFEFFIKQITYLWFIREFLWVASFFLVPTFGEYSCLPNLFDFLYLFHWVGWNSYVSQSWKSSFDRPAVVREGAHATVCVLWPEGIGSRKPSVCVLPFLLIWVELPGVDATAQCVLSMSCCFNYLLPEQGLGRVALHACLSMTC